MDIIFLDTSIFEANNFLESKRIQEVYRMAERGDIKVVLPQLTYDEIIHRISKNVDDSHQKFQKYREETRILRNVPSLSAKFEPFVSEKIKEEFYIRLNNTFADSHFLIIDYPTLNIADVFKSYFEKKAPFGSGGKKNEFPDAFVLKSLETWAQDQRVKVLVFSKDNDILKYKSHHLEVIDDFELYLSDKIKEIEGVKHQKRLDRVDSIIKAPSNEINEEIKSWVISQLDDNSKFYDYSNYFEVHDISIIKVDIDIENYNITNISNNYISVELLVLVNYKVELLIDVADYMFKDYDTKEWIFPETKTILVDELRHIDVELAFGIDPNKDEVYEPKIEVINGGRELNV